MSCNVTSQACPKCNFPVTFGGGRPLGHAWDTTLQDMIIRYKRMQGYDALWLPGMDHAGIATQAKVEAR